MYPILLDKALVYILLQHYINKKGGVTFSNEFYNLQNQKFDFWIKKDKQQLCFSILSKFVTFKKTQWKKKRKIKFLIN